MKSSNIIIMMGPMSSGKTFLGEKLAVRLQVPFFEPDGFHTPAAKEKMRRGIPLTDTDRQPWLRRIATAIKTQHDNQQSSVFACSALKRAYRDRLRVVPITFVYLETPREVLEHRARTRIHEYMPASLVQSQLDALEPPAADETDVISISSNQDANKILTELTQDLLP